MNVKCVFCFFPVCWKNPLSLLPAMKIKSIVDHTAKALEDMIVKGKLKPGQKVKELEISTRLGISRPPLREAFKILESEGLVRREPRRGVFVSELKDRDIWE